MNQGAINNLAIAYTSLQQARQFLSDPKVIESYRVSLEVAVEEVIDVFGFDLPND